MISFAETQLALYNWVSTELGVTTIWADQSEMRPPRPYVSLKLISGPRRTGHDEVRQPVSGSFEVSGMRQVTLALNAFGEDSLSLISRLQTSLEKPSVQDTLAARGIAFIRAEAVQNLTAALDNRFESRYQMDAVFGLAENEMDTVGPIESVELTNDADGSTVVIED